MHDGLLHTVPPIRIADSTVVGSTLLLDELPHEVVGVMPRGFDFPTSDVQVYRPVWRDPLAVRLGAGFIPIRKLGKLPGATISRQYALEYGAGHLEMHRDEDNDGLVVDGELSRWQLTEAERFVRRTLGPALP